MALVKADMMNAATATGAFTRARLYVKRIRNAQKQRYATEYLSYLVKGGQAPANDGLSSMAAQAVRLQINAIFEITGDY